jgi:hypothetical protein
VHHADNFFSPIAIHWVALPLRILGSVWQKFRITLHTALRQMFSIMRLSRILNKRTYCFELLKDGTFRSNKIYKTIQDSISKVPLVVTRNPTKDTTEKFGRQSQYLKSLHKLEIWSTK